MGTATEPVRGSGCWPAWTARVEKPRFFGSPFNANPRFDRCCGGRRDRRRGEPPRAPGILTGAGIAGIPRDPREAGKIPPHERAPILRRLLSHALGGPRPPPPGADPPPHRGGLDRLRDPRAG